MNPPNVIAHTMSPITLGQIPTIGMVAAPASGGHVGIGIGIPIMAASGQILQQSPATPLNQQQPTQHGFASPDSSDDFRSVQSQSPAIVQQSPLQHSGPVVAPPGWPGGAFLGGLGYPLMGMTAPPSVFGEANMYYGLNFLNGHPQPALANPPGAELSMLPLQHPPLQNSVPPLDSMPIQTPPKELPPSLSNGKPSKEIIHCKSCTLFPPNPVAPLPTTREKPSGCRTVFVGGLPENMTEDMVREVFDNCGEITTVRMSKKNFCHVRFQNESYVDGAIGLSGYRIRIGSNNDAANLGRFHVDYAQARDDLYEWECRQRQFQREQRHRDRLEQERLLPPSPPPIVHFSEHEAITLAENIKVNEHFGKSIQTLITWLERGDCSKRNSAMFYSMVQSTNSHVKRLLSEKSQYAEELKKAKAVANQRIQGISIQFSQVEKVFLAASHKKAWDYFTKPQRKNIDLWKKQLLEILSSIGEAAGSDNDMDFSDSDREDFSDQPNMKKRRTGDDDSQKSNIQLQEENDSLRCQIEAFKNEVDLIKADVKSELEQRDARIQSLQRQLELPIDTSRNIASESSSRTFTGSQLSPTQSDTTDNQNSSKSSTIEINCDSSSTTNHSTVKSRSSTTSISSTNTSSITTGTHIAEARLIGIISTFLNVHPFGASLDYITSFVKTIIPTIRLEEIQTLLLQYPEIFKQETSGVGVNLETKWSFVGFSRD